MDIMQFIVLSFIFLFGIGYTFIPVFTFLIMVKFVLYINRIMGLEEATQEYVQKKYSLLLTDPKAFGKQYEIQMIIIRIMGITALGLALFMLFNLI